MAPDPPPRGAPPPRARAAVARGSACREPGAPHAARGPAAASSGGRREGAACREGLRRGGGPLPGMGDATGCGRRRGGVPPGWGRRRGGAQRRSGREGRERVSEVMKTLSPSYIPRVTYRVEMGCWALRWATVIRSGPRRLSALVNVLTEAFMLEKPPRLISINRGGHFIRDRLG